MAWFGATIVVAIEPETMGSGELVVHEETYLLEAKDAASAQRMAFDIGKKIEALDDTLTLDGAPARRFFAGISKIVPTQNLTGEATGQPISGCEIMYQEFTVKSKADLSALLSGQATTITRILDT